MSEAFEKTANVSILVPSNPIGRLLLIKAGMLDGWWITFRDGRFTLDVRKPEDPQPLADDCCAIASVTPVDPHMVDEHIRVFEQVDALNHAEQGETQP